VSAEFKAFYGPMARRVYIPVRGELKAVHGLGRDDRVAEGARLEGVCTRKGTVGSNPTLSVTPLAVMFRSYAMGCCLTPSEPEGSSGTQYAHEPYPA
jgi:hypothetical protein